jgi:glycosyltransferase involved in cell wall biosynthesis
VSAYVRAAGAPGPVFEAPQAADVAFWTAPAQPERHAPFQALFAGRLEREKGVDVLLEAWRQSSLDGALVVCGEGPLPAPGALTRGPCGAAELRNLYAGSDVVVVPSVATRDFLEPWGMVVNEAFHQGVPVIATTAVGAAAGGLVEHERTGLVVPPGDAVALAGALRRLHDDRALRERLGRAAQGAASAYTPAAWAEGMSRALGAVGAAKGLLA